MKRYSELLYWMDYMELIHYDEKTKKCTYDPKLPERARKSFEKWLKESKW